jgi:hypothetical protein
MNLRLRNTPASPWCPFRLLLASALALTPSLYATTYFVSTTGSDSNSGTQSAPFRHLSKGASAASQPGDTVIVMDGTYDNEGQVDPNYVVTLYYSGTPGHPITFQAQHHGMAILDSMSTSTTTTCNGAYSYFNLYNASFIVIQGFVIQRGCHEGIHSNDSAHDIVIEQNQIQYIANHTQTDQIGQDGIYLNTTEYNFTFDSNIFHDIGRTDGQPLNHFDHGIYSHASNVTITNNIFYNMNKGWSIQLADGANGHLIANNTFAFPDASATGEDGQIAFWGANTNITLANNIFYEPTNYPLFRYQATLSGCVFEHNLVYPMSTAMADTSGCTVTANVTGNPQFMNSSTAPYNFQTQPGGAGIDAGMNLSQVTADFAGTPRPQGSSTDIGAYEYQTPAAPPPPPPSAPAPPPPSAPAPPPAAPAPPPPSAPAPPPPAAPAPPPPAAPAPPAPAAPVPPPPAATPPSDITSALMAWWKFTDGSGNSAFDFSGNGNSATLHNPTWRYSNFGITGWFNGSNSYGSVQESESLEMSNELTIAFWARPSVNRAVDPRVVSKLYDWDVKLNGSLRLPQFTAGGQYAMLNYSLPLAAWRHVVFTFSNGVVKGYVDGLSVGLSVNTFTQTTLPQSQYGLYIGAYDSSVNNPYRGSLDDLRIYSRALSPEDVTALYHALPRLY